MCDPISIGGAVLTLGSLAANSAASGQVADARNDALAAERIRQQGFDKQSQALNAQSQDRYKDFGGQQDKKAGELADFYKGETASAVEGAPQAMPASSSNVTVREQGVQKGKADAFNNQQADALGGLRSFGDVMGGIGRLQARDASQIGQIGGFKRGSSNLLPLDLDAAQSAAGGLGTLGDILGGAGQLGISAGLGGAGSGLFGGGAPTVTGKALPFAQAGAKVPGGASTFGFNPYSIY
jgi:hypothetical protein